MVRINNVLSHKRLMRSVHAHRFDMKNVNTRLLSSHTDKNNSTSYYRHTSTLYITYIIKIYFFKLNTISLNGKLYNTVIVPSEKKVIKHYYQYTH